MNFEIILIHGFNKYLLIESKSKRNSYSLTTTYPNTKLFPCETIIALLYILYENFQII